MECLGVALSLAFLAGAITLVVMTIVSFLRVRVLKRRLGELTAELANQRSTHSDLFRRLLALEGRTGSAAAAAAQPSPEAATGAKPAPTPVPGAAPEVEAGARPAGAPAPWIAPAAREPESKPAEPAEAGPDVAGPETGEPYPEEPGAAAPPPPPPTPAPPPGTVPGPAPGPSRPAAPRPAAAPPPPPRSAIDWERWIGVRGAAVLGGVVLALAAVYFLKYSIEHGLIPPEVRVAIGVAVGLGTIVGSERLRRRDYVAAADALAGSGVVILYATFWAAHTLYELIGNGTAFVLMALVTAAAGVLAWRYSSQVIAILGLAGGFATPSLLSTGEDRPIALFGYLLLVNAGLLILARRRGWPALGLLGIGGTAIYQAWWIVGRMGPGRVFLGLAILAVFALLYAVGGRGRAGEGESRGRSAWALNRAGAVLLPFLFAVHLARSAELAPHLYPTAALLALLSVAALWITHARTREGGEEEWLALAAAAGDLGVVTLWCLRSPLDPAQSWEAVAVAVVLAAIFHVGYELDRSRRRRRATRAEPVEPAESDDAAAAAEPGGRPTPARAGFAAVAAEGSSGGGGPALLAAGGFLLVAVFLPLRAVAPDPWPWLAAWLVLAALLLRQAESPGRENIQLFAAIALALGLGQWWVFRGGAEGAPAPALWFGIVAAVAVGFQILALRRRDQALAHTAELGAAVVPAGFLLALLGETAHPALAVGLYLPATIVFALLGVLAVTRLRSGTGYLGATLLLALVHALWTAGRGTVSRGPSDELLAFVLLAGSAVVFTFWPFLAAGAFRERRFAWIAAALAGPAWFLPLRELWETRFGDGAIGLLPVALGALALAAAYRARGLWSEADPRRKSALAWLAAVALGFVSVAIPLQLDKEWVLLGWALEGVAVVALWKRLDHAGLKYFGLALLTMVTARLLSYPTVLGFYPRSGWPILNWLAYTYLVPAAALLGSASILARLEIDRKLPWERDLYSAGHPMGAVACSLAAIAVVFVWINLAIFDLFATGPTLVVSWGEPLLARDLTLSLAWAVYALMLLAIGMAKDSSGLRWLSLGFLVLTIGKVFLYDLGQLRDLYRVASLVGLALSLIGVSLAYQRFVFRKRAEEEKEEVEEG